MESLGFVAIPGIVVICFLVAEVYKAITAEKYNKFIPALVGIIGGILGGMSFLFFIDYLPAKNILEAVAIGIVSGFSATGINELKEMVFKRGE